jgi:iron-only hydrogenase group A
MKETLSIQATVRATINGQSVEVPRGTSVLEAARGAAVRIPTLCKHRDLLPTAACGLCVVRNKGGSRLLRACCTELEEGMEIATHDAEIVDVRRATLELILSNHPHECLTCGRNGECELQSLAADFSIRQEAIKRFVRDVPCDRSTGSIVLDFTKCIKCGRCIQVCQEMQDVWALSFLQRGIHTRMAPAGDILLAESPCVKCGQCSAHCPTGAITEADETATVWEALNDKSKLCVAQIAPSVRVTIGEAFGLPPGTNLTRKLYTALRRLGFHAVFDTNFAADVTIVEEASEFVERFARGKGVLPLITSCCPAWTEYMEKNHADFIEHFSTVKSPQQIMGTLAKTYYAEKASIDPARLFMVSIMPCTAKKDELARSAEMFASGQQDVDVCLTTRELARMLRQSGIDFLAVEDGEADSPLGDYSGAGTIFGTTGGVMEAALRTACFYATGEKLETIEFASVRGLEGVRRATVMVAGQPVRVAVAHGLRHVASVLEEVREAKRSGAEVPYHFIEVMACPGGCIGGGGQPYGVDNERRQQRAAGLYREDGERSIRYSHENPAVERLYREFLNEPLGTRARELLHTRYEPLPLYRR